MVFSVFHLIVPFFLQEKKDKKNRNKPKPENKSQAAVADDGGDDVSVFQIDQ